MQTEEFVLYVEFESWPDADYQHSLAESVKTTAHLYEQVNPLCLTSCCSTQVVSEAAGGEEDGSVQEVDPSAADAPRWTWTPSVTLTFSDFLFVMFIIFLGLMH